jgi:4-amino-4-deoxy-L-arabinose transferase-like glycosyltransferase
MPGPADLRRTWQGRPDPLAPFLNTALWGLALYYLAAFFFLAWRHILYPFELEWMEGGMLDHVNRLLQGKQLYAPPSLEFTAFSYAPLYFYLAAALGKLFGAGFALLRSISVLATLATLLLIGRWVWLECGSRRAGALAAALYLACYPVSGSWYDLARVDSLFLLLLLGGFYLLRRGRSTAGVLGAALLLALAFFCKQTALIITLPVLVHYLVSEKSFRRWIFLAAWLMLLLGIGGLMQRSSDGWFAYYLFYLPSQHPPVYWRIHHFWIDYFFKPLPFATLAIAAAMLVGRWWRGTNLFWLFFAIGLFGGPWLASVPSGAFHNVVMPAHAALALLVAPALAGWRSAGLGRHSLTQLQGIAVLQLLMLLYNPLAHLPVPDDRQAGMELIRRLTAAPGPVWIPGHGYLARMAGKEGCAHRCAMDDVLRGKDEPGKAGLQREMNEAIRSGKYAVLVADSHGLPVAVPPAYQPGRPIFSARDCFYPVTGWQTRPEVWYEREGQ